MFAAYRYKVSAITLVKDVEKRVTTAQVSIVVSTPDTDGVTPGTGT